MTDTVNELLKGADKSTFECIFSYYKEKINSESWKTEIGSINGFVTFIQNFLDIQKFNNQWINFSLSVGLKLTEIHDDEWKLLGLRVLQLILCKGVRIF